MSTRKKSAKDLAVNLTDVGSIDDLMNGENTVLTYTSPSAGKTIKLSVHRFFGDDIINKTEVHPKNKRKQVYLTAMSLEWLIKSLKKTNQVSPALGRIEADGSITILYGSRRRKASHLAGTEFVVLASKDLTDDIAEEISDAENISEDISLIERGHLWKDINTNEGLSSRDISVQIENSKISHTIIAAGIAGAKLPLELIKLYPSTNTIGRQTISKLSTSCKNKTIDEIIAFVTSDLPEIITNLWDAHRDENHKKSAELTTTLTDSIFSFAVPIQPIQPSNKPLKTNKVFTKGVNAKVDSSGRVEYITFDKKLSKINMSKLNAFLKSL
jgi:ParB/RepB/Spo0J family partition protein